MTMPVEKALGNPNIFLGRQLNPSRIVGWGFGHGSVVVLPETTIFLLGLRLSNWFSQIPTIFTTKKKKVVDAWKVTYCMSNYLVLVLGLLITSIRSDSHLQDTSLCKT